jgi:hypothetical protein
LCGDGTSAPAVPERMMPPSTSWLTS